MRTAGMAVLTSLFLSLLPSRETSAVADLAPPDELDRACRSWLLQMIRRSDAWGPNGSPRIGRVADLPESGVTLARVYAIEPEGFVIVQSLRELPPVIVFSERSRPGPSLDNAVLQRILEDLTRRAVSSGSEGPAPGVHPGWAVRHGAAPTDGFRESASPHAGPLISSNWHQRAPYWYRTPAGDGGPCRTGSFPVAAGQILYYHRWPARGGPVTTTEQYLWDGDDSCGGSTPSQSLSADYVDFYDWDNMRDDYAAGADPLEIDAVAELLYEIGVAGHVDFGHCATEWNPDFEMTVLLERFRCSPALDWQWRGDHTATGWFDMIRTEVDAGRPLMLLSDEWAVIDGYDVIGGGNYVHVNWGVPSATGWYYAEGPPYPEAMIRYIEPDSSYVHLVTPDGGGEFPTIQAAVDGTAPGEEILLADGVYTGPGNLPQLGAQALWIHSLSGDPASCVLDGEGDSGGSASVRFLADGGLEMRLEGVSIVNCASPGPGGGVRIEDSSPTLRHCVISGCEVSGDARGGGVYCGPTTSPTFRSCTIAANAADFGGGLHLAGSASVSLLQCVVRGNGAGTAGAEVYLADPASWAFFYCSAVDTAGIDGPGGAAVPATWNSYDDPLFCRPVPYGMAPTDSGDYHVADTSPCLPGQLLNCGLIGALDAGCAAGTGVVPGSAPVARLSLLSIAPNPFGSSTRVSFSVPLGGAPALLEIYDVGGRRVRAFDSGALPAGPHSLLWDGRDHRGVPVASGVYFLRLSWGDETVTRKLSRAR